MSAVGQNSQLHWHSIVGMCRDIQAAQADLRGESSCVCWHAKINVTSKANLLLPAVLLERVDKTQDEADKLVASNGMLQTYIDNMSKQMSLTRR